MIVGTGIDIIEIYRIGNLVNKRRTFLDRFFTTEENNYFKIKGEINIESIAGYFACKEAVVKALGTGFSGIAWKDVEIKKTSMGQPQVCLHGMAKEVARKKQIKNIMVSISHSKEYAIAQAIAIG